MKFSIPAIIGMVVNMMYNVLDRIYIRPLIQGTLFNLCTFGLNHSINSDGNPNIYMFTMRIATIINIILELVFIFCL
ncbi:hypothetical protein [Clostridium sp. UBA3887]|uniref:hypothetical protein n=1 Tax=Clostridium sp. UBA3887 TaxID=1946356 RepID=UPI003216BFE9